MGSAGQLHQSRLEPCCRGVHPDLDLGGALDRLFEGARHGEVFTSALKALPEEWALFRSSSTKLWRCVTLARTDQCQSERLEVRLRKARLLGPSTFTRISGQAKEDRRRGGGCVGIEATDGRGRAASLFGCAVSRNGSDGSSCSHHSGVMVDESMRDDKMRNKKCFGNRPGEHKERLTKRASASISCNECDVALVDNDEGEQVQVRMKE